MTRLIGFRWKHFGWQQKASDFFGVPLGGGLLFLEDAVLVVLAIEVHPIPYRTRKLSLSAPMVLRCDGGGE
jgi:hypothetical protein